MDLTARAIIVAVDRFSGPVTSMAGALNAFQSRASGLMRGVADSAVAAQEKLNRAHTAITRMPIAAPAAFGLAALIERTQEFEKYALGTKIASIPDAFNEVADEFGRMHRSIDFDKINAEGKKFREGAMELSQTLGIMPAQMMKATMSASKMGLAFKQSMALAREAAIWSMADDEMAPEHGVETLGGWAYQFGAPKDDPKAYAAWVKAIADKAKTVADRTPTALRPFAEGIKQVAPLWAQTGGTFDELAAIIGTASLTKQNEIEIGTATKMALVRAINPTLLNASSWAKAGMKKSDYMNLMPQDPIKATNQIISTYSGYLSKGARPEVRSLIEQAIKEGDVLGAVEPLAAMVAKSAGGAFKHDELRLAIANIVTAGGLQFKGWKYLRDTAQQLKDGTIGFQDFVQRFSGFHASRMMSFLAHPEWMDELLELSKRTEGLGQDAREQLFRESRFGRWGRFKAAWDRLVTNVGGSDPMLWLMERLEKWTEAGAKNPFQATGEDFARQMQAGWASFEAAWESAKSKFAAHIGTWEGLKAQIDALPNPFEGLIDKIKKFFGFGGTDEERARAYEEFKRRTIEGRKQIGGPSVPSVPHQDPDALIRSLDRWSTGTGDQPGPRPQQAPGPVQVEGEARVKVDIDIHGLPAGVTATQRPGGDASVPLNTGKGMSDLKRGGPR